MKRKILIVDDDWAVLEVLKITFSAAGYEVFLAQNESEFREVALHQGADIIILDIMLGDRDGLHVYDELLTQGLSAHIPVIFLSVLAKDIRQIPPQKGRNYALIAKPFDPEKLVEEIACLTAD
jgi:DNA-binding response OmpR family regulator